MAAVAAVIGMALLSACVTDPATGKKSFSPTKWFEQPSTQTALKTTLAVVEQQALRAAQTAVLSLATSYLDGQAKSNALDSVAQGLYANMGSIVTGQDVQTIVQAWSPSDGAAYETLAGQLASIYESVLKAHASDPDGGKAAAAAVVQSIAQGLNGAAAAQRAAASTSTGSGPSPPPVPLAAS